MLISFSDNTILNDEVENKNVNTFQTRYPESHSENKLP